MASTATKTPKTTASSRSKAPSKSAAKSVSSTSKPAPDTATPRAAAKPAVATVVEGPQPVILGPTLRKRELVETIVTQTGMKKRDVKPVVEAALSVLGTALGDNRELNLQPFGRLKVRKERELPNGRVVVAKVRQVSPKAKTDKPPS